MAGILGNFTPTLDAPNPTIVPIDQGTNNLINQAGDRANQSTQSFSDQQNQGVSQAGHQAQQNQAQADQSDESRGYSGNAINQAIRNQYNAQGNANVQHIQDAYNQNAVFQKSAALQQSAAEAMARQNVSTQAYSQLMKAYNDTETARAQVLSSILGAGGMAGGAYAGMKSGKGNGGDGTATTKGSPGYLPGGGYQDGSTPLGSQGESGGGSGYGNIG